MAVDNMHSKMKMAAVFLDSNVSHVVRLRLYACLGCDFEMAGTISLDFGNYTQKLQCNCPIRTCKLVYIPQTTKLVVEIS